MIEGARFAVTADRMFVEGSRVDALRLMLADIVYEAALIRPTDPIKAAQLDAAANDLRSVIDEPDADALSMTVRNILAAG